MSLCAYSPRCKTLNPRVIVTDDERYCGKHGSWVAGDLVGDYVRNRDGRCVVCLNPGPTDWAHVIGRGRAPYIRYEPTNGLALCRRDHDRMGASPARWRAWLDEHIPGLWDRLNEMEVHREAARGHIDVGAVIREFRSLVTVSDV